MDLTASLSPPVATTRAAAGARAWLPASGLLAGTLITLVGLTWDVEWHDDVGPDTFFTLPHLFLYTGSAIAGLVSLVVVLSTTAAQRAGRPVDEAVGGRAVGVFGRTFAAPVGYLVAGTGGALFLLYGLWDLWWHSLYGFDAVIDSPPHIGLLLSVMVTMVGTVMVFAAARSHRWGVFGTLASVAVLLSFSSVTVLGLSDVDTAVNAVTIGMTFLSVMLILVARGFLGRPGGALGAAVLLGAWQAFSWWFSPWAAHAYAAAVGLPLRDNVDDLASMPALMPMCLVGAALLAELVLWATSRRGSAPRWAGALAGAVAGFVVAGAQPFQDAWLYETGVPAAGQLLATAGVGASFGLLGGYLGWRFGGMLRLLAPAREKETV
ncbi:hypothetical protein [Amycolatopsis albispora]|uniref:Uncharacterized protein n=1 Tax=Amycolatopsis albispora TaxID=1804986 RepID=A0A344LCJ1_9PSEU|nr:hypothetical protein [Amycolatopsis albispora]AXB45765.1 hypothetical protein A4R43_27490 [Amycolatopsis albispora]